MSLMLRCVESEWNLRRGAESCGRQEVRERREGGILRQSRLLTQRNNTYTSAAHIPFVRRPMGREDTSNKMMTPSVFGLKHSLTL